MEILTNNIATWALLAVVSYLVKTLLQVNQSLIAIEVRVNEHERRLGIIDDDLKKKE